MKIYTQNFPQDSTKHTQKLQTRGPKQSTIDAIMAFASRYEYVAKS